MLISTVIFFIFISIFIGISQTTGPIINMLLMMGMDYDTRLSIALTYLFLIGGAIASIWKNASKKNPKTGKSSVNLDLILLTLPLMCSGALFGTIFKNFLSQIIITLLFMGLFLFLIYDVFKTIKERRAANKMEKKKDILIQLEVLKAPPQQALHTQQKSNQVKVLKTPCQQTLGTKQKPNQIKVLKVTKEKLSFLAKLKRKLTKFVNYDARPGSKNKLIKVILLCITYYFYTLFTYLIRGGLRYKSIIGINSCGGQGWIVLASHVLISILVSAFIAYPIIKDTSDLTEGQIKRYRIQVTNKNFWYFLFIGFVAGFFAGLMAIAAALILVPSWLKLGVDKQYPANSTAPLILIASSVTFSVSYFNHVFDSIPTEVLIFYVVFAFFSSAMMKDLFGLVTKKYKFESFALIILLIVLIATVILLFPFKIGKVVQNYDKLVKLGVFC